MQGRFRRPCIKTKLLTVFVILLNNFYAAIEIDGLLWYNNAVIFFEKKNELRMKLNMRTKEIVQVENRQKEITKNYIKLLDDLSEAIHEAEEEREKEFNFFYAVGMHGQEIRHSKF